MTVDCKSITRSHTNSRATPTPQSNAESIEVSQTNKNKDAQKTAAGVANVNRYEVLSDLDIEDYEASDKSGDVINRNKQNNLRKKREKGKKKQRSEVTSHEEVHIEENIPNEQRHYTKALVVVAGDSIIKYVKG